MVCGECGRTLSPGERACPQCGSRVDFPASRQTEKKTGDRCQSCGHANPSGSTFCESCGIRLTTGKRKEGGKKRTRSALSGMHLPAIVVALLFGGWGLYDDLGREIPDVSSAGHEAQTEISTAQFQEIQSLQRMVEAHPEDDAMLLRLANLLQDYAREDHRLVHIAVETYERYLARNPGDENARVDLGICYFDLAGSDTARASELIQRAIREIQSVAEQNPRHQAAAFNLGIITLNAGLTDISSEWFRRAAAIDPSSNLGVRAAQILEEHSFPE